MQGCENEAETQKKRLLYVMKESIIRLFFLTFNTIGSFTHISTEKSAEISKS